MSGTLNLFGVTTLIKLGLGTSEALVNWAVNTTVDAAIDKRVLVAKLIEDDSREAAVKYLRDARWQKSGRAMMRGTDLHTAVEQLALGEAVTADVSIMPYVMQFKGWLDTFAPSFVMAEAPVYNLGMRYAGTLDGILDIGGRRLLYDVKTTDKPPDSEKMRPPYPEVALQLAAYSRAQEVGVVAEQRYSGRGRNRYYIYDPEAQHEAMPEIDGAICIVVSPFDCFAVPVCIDDEVWRCFQAVCKCAQWTLRGSTDLFGTPLVAEAVMA